MFTIVTHHTPDLDAVSSVWLIKRFLPNWQDAFVAFVPAGKTLDLQVADSDPHILHVDTGFGQLDHHQTDEFTCAAKKTYEYIRRKKDTTGKWEDEVLERMVDVVNFYDHFGEAKLKDGTADYQQFQAVSIFDGLKLMYSDDDHKIVEMGSIVLDAIYKAFQERIWAEEVLDKDGIEFATEWGKAVAFETHNDEVLKLAQKSGFVIAIRKDPKKSYIRIKGHPESKVDFTSLYQELKKKDPTATWFLHSSKKMLLNGTTKNPDMRPTSLTLQEIINVLKK